jgi:hypothetical protein
LKKRRRAGKMFNSLLLLSVSAAPYLHLLHTTCQAEKYRKSEEEVIIINM